MKSNKKIQVTTMLKGALLFTLLTLATACSGGGGQQQSSSIDGSVDVSVDGNTSVPSVRQSNLKMELCDEVNGWETDCRFLGMKFIKQNPEEIIPLAEEHGRGRNRGGREA